MIKKNNEVTLKEALQAMVDRYKMRPKLHEAKIKQEWANIMGPSINKHTKNVYLKRDTLYVQIVSAPLKQELSFAKHKIIKILNEELGAEVVKHVELI